MSAVLLGIDIINSDKITLTYCIRARRQVIIIYEADRYVRVPLNPNCVQYRLRLHFVLSLLPFAGKGYYRHVSLI